MRTIALGDEPYPSEALPDILSLRTKRDYEQRQEQPRHRGEDIGNRVFRFTLLRQQKDVGCGGNEQCDSTACMSLTHL